MIKIMILTSVNITNNIIMVTIILMIAILTRS